MKKFVVSFLLVFLTMVALPVYGVLASPVTSPQHIQQAPAHGAGQSARVSKISITRHFSNTNSGGQLGPWNASIGFSNGVPVGGWANLTIYSDGSYNFSGHFHDSGAVGYSTSIAWAVKDSNGTVYTFAHSGNVGGTFSFSSRDDDWNNSGTNPALAAGWNALAYWWSYQWEAGANFSLSSLLGITLQVIGVVGAVIAIV